MAKEMYQIRFDGTVTGEFDLETTKQRFEKIYCLARPALDRLFSGDDVIVKKNLTEDDAMRFAMKIVETGCESVIERMPVPGEEHLAPRSSSDRRRRYRRDSREFAIVPDRRINIRRQEDFEYFQELILNDADIPVAFGSYSTYIVENV